MAEFLTDERLSNSIGTLFRYASKFIFIVCPYIKFHPKINDFLSNKSRKDLQLHILYRGKHSGEDYLNFDQESLNTILKFENLLIVRNPDLHAKFYANENFSILSSMNLYDYSFDNNIEFGIRVESDSNYLENFRGYRKRYDFEINNDAFAYFSDIMHSSKIVYSSSNYRFRNKSVNRLTEFFEKGPKIFQGYCIRTGQKIPFNPEKPMSYDAYQVWVEFGNMNYPENYCHKTGRPSNGRTSMRNPILFDN